MFLVAHSLRKILSLRVNYWPYALRQIRSLRINFWYCAMRKTLSLCNNQAGCTRHASCALFGHICLISWRHVLFWCVWYDLRSSKSEARYRRDAAGAARWWRLHYLLHDCCGDVFTRTAAFRGGNARCATLSRVVFVGA